MSGGVLSAIAMALAIVAAPAADLLSPKAFRDRYAAAVQRLSGRSTMSVDDQTFRTKNADGTDLTINVDNAYALYRADPTQLDSVIDRFSRVFLQAGTSPAESIDNLVVIIRPSDYLTRSVAPGASLASFTSPRPMAGDLSFFLAVDSAEAIRTASVTDLKRWNVDVATAWRRAIANIKARVGPLTPIRLGDEKGPFGFGAASGLAPSILADPALCGQSAKDGLNKQVVLLYSKDMFLVGDPRDASMMKMFWNTVEQEVSAGRPLSTTPLTCRDGHWVIAKHSS